MSGQILHKELTKQDGISSHGPNTDLVISTQVRIDQNGPICMSLDNSWKFWTSLDLSRPVWTSPDKSR